MTALFIEGENKSPFVGSSGIVNGSGVQGEYTLFSHRACTYWIAIQSIVLSLDDESVDQAGGQSGGRNREVSPLTVRPCIYKYRPPS